MKASGRENSAVVEFTGKVQRIARVHQYGLRDRPRAYAEDVKYPQRQLLGLSDINIKEIELLVVKHISN